jgi:hypothetical protein
MGLITGLFPPKNGAVMRDCREARYRWPRPPSYGCSVKLMAQAQRRVAVLESARSRSLSASICHSAT